MTWLSALIFALACTGSPAPAPAPAETPAAPDDAPTATASAAPSSPATQPAAALDGKIDLDAPIAVAWTSPPASWRPSSADTSPSRQALLPAVAAVDPAAPQTLQSPAPALRGAPDAWQPRWGRVQTDIAGKWLLWWNQEEPRWEAWRVSLDRGRAEKLYEGPADGRPAWLVAVATPPGQDSAEPSQATAADWWQRYDAALQLPADAFDARLALARDPHPAVRGAAVAALTWTLRHADDTATLQAHATAVQPLLAELVASNSPRDRIGAVGLALSTLDPGAVAAAVPLLCDPDPDVGPATLSLLADLLPPDALAPWQLHPRWDIGQIAARALAAPAHPDDGSPQAVAWPGLRDAAATAWSAAGCTPAFQGRYDVGLWSPSLVDTSATISLRSEDGATLTEAQVSPSASWTGAVALSVDQPPATIDVVIGDTRASSPAPLGGGAALGLACDTPTAPPDIAADPAELWRATRASPGRARCLAAVTPALVSHATALTDDALLAELADLLSPQEAQAVAGSLVHSTAQRELRRTLAQRFLLPLRGADCAPGARALLGTDLVEGDLALRLRRCHSQHPDLYADVLDAVEDGTVAVNNLLPMQPGLDDDTLLRIQQVAADALRTAAPDAREAPFRVLMGASGGNPRRGPRHTTILTLPEGGAAIGLPDPCAGEGEGGFDLQGGDLILGPTPTTADGPLRVELLTPAQASELERITCGDRELWTAPQR